MKSTKINENQLATFKPQNIQNFAKNPNQAKIQKKFLKPSNSS